MAEFLDREHFIPIRVSDLVDLLCTESGPLGGQRLNSEECQAFRRFAHSIRGNLHAEYHLQLEKLKDDYAPFDPDADPKPLKALAESIRDTHLANLFAGLSHLMQRANYVQLSRDELERVMQGASDWGIDMSVAWDAFERIEIFYRGKGLSRRTRRRWRNWFRKEEITLPTFQRVLVVIKQKKHRRLGRDADLKNVFCKLFKDIPQMDIEMLLPATRIKMPIFDRLKLGGSVSSSIGYVGWKLGTAGLSIDGFGSALLTGSIWTLYTPIALIFGYGYKTWYSFQASKQTYSLQLTQSLYYQNLDNNAGVLYRMLDDAEEQEAREMLLGYFYLWRYAGEGGWTAGQLDDYVEIDLEKRLEMKVDFEIGDALRKLVEAGIAECIGERYRALPMPIAQAKLEAAWDRHGRI